MNESIENQVQEAYSRVGQVWCGINNNVWSGIWLVVDSKRDYYINHVMVSLQDGVKLNATEPFTLRWSERIVEKGFDRKYFDTSEHWRRLL